MGLGEETEKKREKRKAQEEALKVYGTQTGSSFQTNPAVSKRRRTPHPVPGSMEGAVENGTEQENGATALESVGGVRVAPPGDRTEGKCDVGMKVGDGIQLETGPSEGSGGTVVQDEDDQSMFVPE